MRQTILLLALFVSGAASLIFEIIWFEWLALHWGRTADASAGLLASFMLGLGLGQLIILQSRRLHNQKIKLWAACETGVALLATGCHWRFAQTADPLGIAALLWLLAPTVLMGMTLPLAVSALKQASLSLGIGRAYTFNTLGAAVGSLVTGYWLLGLLGLEQASMLAVGLQLLAAGLLCTQFRSLRPATPPLEASINTASTAVGANQAKALLAVAASGLVILGMEMLWFRALLLTHRSTTENFAVMLTLVLLGLAIGSAFASQLIATRKNPATINSRHTLIAALLASQALLATLGFLSWTPSSSTSLPQLLILVGQGALLILPACLLSGALLVIASEQLKNPNKPSQATAKLVLASTIGSAVGAPLVTLWLMPYWGWSNSLLILLGFLLVVSILNAWRIGLVAAAAMVLLAAPVSQHWQQAQASAAKIYLELDGAQSISQSDGQYQSVQLLESRFLGQVISHRLMTDSYSMTSTATDSERYMRLFAWLPRAFNQQLSDVLLISYGIGSTAEALLDNPNTQKLLIADPSSAILKTSRLIQRQPEPLDDPRVVIRLDDGRKVLAESANRFDLVTGEPPPPRLAGMHALYSAEYFALMHRALKPEGLASYWLPVDQLSLTSSKAIIKAFCLSFKDCSLWAGSHYNWILLGSKQGIKAASAEALSQLWERPQDQARLLNSGFEHAAQIASTFIADALTLQSWTLPNRPVEDNWPRRIEPNWPSANDIQTYAQWQDNNLAEQRFHQSIFFKQWQLPTKPLELAWTLQPLLNGQFRPEPEQRLQVLSQVLALSPWQTPVLWLLGTDQNHIQIALQQNNPSAKLHQAVALLANHRFDEAEVALAALGQSFPLANNLAELARQQQQKTP